MTQAGAAGPVYHQDMNKTSAMLMIVLLVGAATPALADREYNQFMRDQSRREAALQSALAQLRAKAADKSAKITYRDCSWSFREDGNAVQAVQDCAAGRPWHVSPKFLERNGYILRIRDASYRSGSLEVYQVTDSRGRPVSFDKMDRVVLPRLTVAEQTSAARARVGRVASQTPAGAPDEFMDEAIPGPGPGFPMGEGSYYQPVPAVPTPKEGFNCERESQDETSRKEP